MESLGTTLKLTRTAITSHLAVLQAESLVHRRGFRPGLRRPSIVYELTPEADRVFPKAYDVFASTLLEEIKHKNPGDLRRYLRHVADRWIARDLPDLHGLRGRERFKAARDVLTKHGFMPVLEQTSAGYLLQEHNCPLMRLAAAHGEVCDMVHHWLEALFDARLNRVHAFVEAILLQPM